AAWLPGWLVPADKSFKEAWVSRKKSDGKDAIHGMQLLISAQELS
ncbi:MAG: hypothetical protein QG632_799, partial [Candidatus Dependentiae bacterium]|nr:hypothetical protein [Candidatus Dependentiae bacterium]